MDIGNLINKRRMELKLTLEEVGNIVGVSKSTVKKWECGDISNMRRDKIALLAKALKINPVSLITGEEMQESNISLYNNFVLTSHEIEVITAYREKVDMQPAVDKLLGVDNKREFIPSLVAARSQGNDVAIQVENVPDLSTIEPDDSDL